MPATVPRDTERHPREARIPAGTDPSGNASANDIPDVEIEEPLAAPLSEPPGNRSVDQTSGPSSSSTAAPPAAVPPPPEGSISGPPRRVKSTRRRGPDIVPRFPQPEPSQDSNKTDSSTFQIDKSLRILRHGTEEQQKLEIRKLHLRWWYAPQAAMERILNAASLPAAVISMVSHVIDTCRSCRMWARPKPDITPTIELVS